MNNIEYVKTGSVKPYDKNPRRNDDSVEFVANSIKEFGFQQPIVVDKDMVVIAGHTRLKAAKKLKLKEVPVIVADNLTDEQAKAYRLADNKVSETSEWDFELLDDELNQILNIDMDDFGFDFTEDEEGEEPEEKTQRKRTDRERLQPIGIRPGQCGWGLRYSTAGPGRLRSKGLDTVQLYVNKQ